MNIPIIPCGMDTTSIQVFASGGTGDLVYQINNGSFQNEFIFYGLTFGIYSIIVKDEKQCENTITFFIDSLQPPIITGVIGIFPICKAANGSRSIQATSGNGTLSYALPGSTFQVSNNFENLAAGLYEIQVADSMECLAKELFELEAIDNLITIQTVETPSICGQANGALSIEGKGPQIH